VIFTWGSIFLCQLRLRQLVEKGVVPKSSFQMPGSPYTSYIGLVFLGLVIVGMAISGWQSSDDFWHKTNFLVVVLGIPIIAILLAIGWMIARPKVVENTGNRLGPVWSDTGPTYPDITDRSDPRE
jgi:L-asparagine permease